MKKNHLIQLAPLLVLSLIVGNLGCGGGSVAAPTDYLQWNAKDGSFRIDYPTGWEADGDGQHGIQWATFEMGSAVIDVSVSFGDSVRGDILGGGGGGEAEFLGDQEEEGGAGDPMAPVAIIHESKKKEFAKDYSDYQEQEPVLIRPRLGEGRKSEFSAKKGFSQVRGYRTTILSSQRGVTVVCRCAASDWEKLKPAFDKILDGITRGSKSS